MTSESYVFGVPLAEKPAIGAMVRSFAAILGGGHLEALVEKQGDYLAVTEASAFPFTAAAQDVRAELEHHLNAGRQ